METTNSIKKTRIKAGLAFRGDCRTKVEPVAGRFTELSGRINGHPGGPISLSSCTVNIFKDWIAQGQPQ